MKRKLTVEYEEFSSRKELPAADSVLLDAAIDALKGSYAPYSHFNVGAAVRLADGTVVKGANQENAAFPSGLCAERTAMFAAGAQHPGVPFEAIAVVCAREGQLMANPGSPCGACRQVMAQYEREAGKPLHIILGSGATIFTLDGVESLMPFVFNDL